MGKEQKQFEKKGYFTNQDGVDSRKLFKPSKNPKVQPQKAKEAPKKNSEKVEKAEDNVTKPK